jgi:hypothetical protein
LIVSEVISNLFNLYKNETKQNQASSRKENLMDRVFNLDKRNNEIKNNSNDNYSNENELQQIIPGSNLKSINDFKNSTTSNNSNNNSI